MFLQRTKHDASKGVSPPPQQFKTHHAPVDEFVEGLAGGGNPWVVGHDAHSDVPEAEYPHVGFKEAIHMLRDAVKGSEGGESVGDDVKAAGATAGNRQSYQEATSIVIEGVPEELEGSMGGFEENVMDVKEEADTSMHGGRPRPGIVLE